MKNGFLRHAEAFRPSAPTNARAGLPVGKAAQPNATANAQEQDLGIAYQRIMDLEAQVQDLESRLLRMEAALVVAPNGNVELFAPGSLKIAAGNRVEIGAAAHVITLDSNGIHTVSAGTVKVDCSCHETVAAHVKTVAPMADFNGVMKCDTLTANVVTATTYTPGAGNIW